MPPIHHDVLEALRARGLLTPAQCERAVARAVGDGCHVEDALVALGMLDERRLLVALGEIHGCQFVGSAKLRAVEPDRASLAALGELARERCLLPIKRAGDGVVVVMAHPGDGELLAELTRRLGARVRPLVGLPAVVGWCVERALGARPGPAPRTRPSRQVPPDVVSLDAFAEWYEALDEAAAVELARLVGVLQARGERVPIELAASIDTAVYSDAVSDANAEHAHTRALRSTRERMLERALAQRSTRLPGGGYGLPAAAQRLRVLRVDHGAARLRVFYGVADDGRVVLLLGGDAGEPGFYERAVERAEALWHRYLEEGAGEP